jgi:nicotinamide mononucleotide transporter
MPSPIEGIKPWQLVLSGIISAGLLLAAWQGWAPMSMIEVVGFISGALCVWLAVKQNIWNWPIAIVNNIAYIIVFWRARLFADMGLQGFYIAIALYGIYAWLRGGEQHTALRVSHVSFPLAATLGVLTVIATYGLTVFLRSVNDAAPFWDALTTVMSLAAQFLLARKCLENWYVWIAADVLYVGLYVSRELYLTAVLYFIFLLMCIQGVRDWRAAMNQNANPSSGTRNGTLAHATT